MLDRLQALMLLSQCNGRDIWPVELCHDKGLPESWIDELADCYESGFQTPLQSIYLDDQLVNQFWGVHDLQLARKLGEYLGVDVQRATESALGREAEVRAIQAAVEEE
jgi:hypothetical protein